MNQVYDIPYMGSSNATESIFELQSAPLSLTGLNNLTTIVIKNNCFNDRKAIEVF